MSNAPASSDSKKLSRTDLLAMAVGQIIGAGVMTMTGIALGYTGRSIPFAYLVAGLLTVVIAIPIMFTGGTANFLGGWYSQIAVLGNQKLAGIYIYVNLCLLITTPMYTLSFADYFLSLVPGVNNLLICTVVLVVMYGMHLLEIKQAARLQNVMTIILALGIASYIVFGVGSIDPNYFDPDQFMTGGVPGFVLACVYLSFACGGANFLTNYSSQAKNPTRDIPFAIAAATIGVVFIYALMSVVAAGVLPVDQVANQPLSVSALAFMPKPIYTFFVVGGGMFALLTSMNFAIGMMVYPAMQACEDGWLPKGFAACNKRFGTPHWILLAYFLVGTVPIFLGIDISTVANSSVVINYICLTIVLATTFRLPKKLPELWNRSRFHISDGKLKIICGLCVAIAVFCTVVCLATSSLPQILSNLAMLAVAIVLAFVRDKHVHLTPSYTEN